MAEETQNQTLEETLEKTDFGHMINENKKLILIAGAITVVLVFVFSIYKQNRDKTYNTNLSNAYDFRVSAIDAYNTKKIKADEFLTKISAVSKEIEGQASLLPALLLAVKNLSAEGKLTESLTILDNWKKHFSANSYNAFFISLKRAAILEDLGKNEEARVELEALKKGSVSILKSKVLLNLARVEMALGQNDKAKANLDIIVKDFKNSDETVLANYYLAQLNKK